MWDRVKKVVKDRKNSDLSFQCQTGVCKTPGSTCLFSQLHQPICGCVRAREVFGEAFAVISGSWRCTNKSRTPLTSSENILGGKTCLKIQLLDNSIHSFNYSKHAQNKLLWVMTCTIKHSVDSSVVERLMITMQNNLLTRGGPESAATVQQFHKAAEALPHSRKLRRWTTTFSDAKKKPKKKHCWIKQSVNTKTSSHQTTEGRNKTATPW